MTVDSRMNLFEWQLKATPTIGWRETRRPRPLQQAGTLTSDRR